jgi:hypothetical protein
MAGITAGSFDHPDETRRPDDSMVEVVRLGGVSAARITVQPGWRWSECIKPVVGTESRHVRHVGVATSGRIHIVHEDGSKAEAGPGSVYIIEPGHDAWVVGEKPFVGYEFESAEAYAKA